VKNKITDLRNHMFAALERLSDETLSEEDLKKEITRSQAISEVGKVIVESAKTEIMFAKLTGKGRENSAAFLDDGEEDGEKPKLIRPEAKYDNNGHSALLDKYAGKEQKEAKTAKK
jgi:hypothetical protein